MTRRVRLLAPLVFALLLCSFPARAADQPLQRAIEAWLADDDATALPLLSKAAKAGDPEARALLARSEAVTPPGGSSAFYKSLSRAGRAELLRAPGGLSGTNWMRVLARKGNPIAIALLAAKLYSADADVVTVLYQAGEHAAAYYLVWEILNRGRWDRIQHLPPDSGIFDLLDYLAWVRAYLPRARALRSDNWAIWDRTPAEGRAGGLMLLSDLTNLLDRDQKLTDFLRDVAAAYRGNLGPLEGRRQLDAFASRLEADAAEDPNLSTLHRLCSDLCPSEVGQCMLAGMTVIGGYEGLIRQHTPYEGLIPEARFRESKRARNTLLRRITTFGAPRYNHEALERSACLAHAVEGN